MPFDESDDVIQELLYAGAALRVTPSLSYSNVLKGKAGGA
jgi:hypothetical protein